MSTFNELYNSASALCRRSSKRCRVCLPLKNFFEVLFFFFFFPLFLFKEKEGDFVDEMMKTN